MSKLNEIAKRRGRVPALVAASAILLWFLVTNLIAAVASTFFYSGGLVNILSDFPSVLLVTVPFSLGVFVSLWAIAPISHELSLRFVLTRAALAAACGVVLADLVRIILAFFGSISATGSVFANSFPIPSFDGGTFVSTLLGTLAYAIPYYLSVLPVVVLACVFLWLWLREHPREYAVAGIIDDV
jgi:hypothetical protein